MKIETISGSCIAVRGNEIDTDRIIPARFMKVVSFDGLGEAAFFDERFNADGSKKSHPFNSEVFQGASILLVNKNFGCGSSREHAPQALMRWGIKAVIGESFAEIFAGNCNSMGIPTASVSAVVIEKLMSMVEAEPGLQMTFNLLSEEVSLNGEVFPVSMNDSSRKALLAGTWDSTASLLESIDEIKKKDQDLPYFMK
jgi:3-isopropylmalate/(R)-2-methylmalate dehydratase small subunit